MQQKLPLEGFRLKKDKSKFTQKLRENYDDGTNKGYILEVYARFDKPLHTIHSGLSFLRDRIDIGKSQKLVCNMFDKKKLCRKQKSLNAGFELRTNARKSSLGNRVQSRSIAKVIRRY